MHHRAEATHLGRLQAENMAAALEPASPAVPTAAADKQYYDDDDQKSCGVHTVLLIANECNPENQKGPILSRPSERSAFFLCGRRDTYERPRHAMETSLTALSFSSSSARHSANRFRELYKSHAVFDVDTGATLPPPCIQSAVVFFTPIEPHGASDNKVGLYKIDQSRARIFKLRHYTQRGSVSRVVVCRLVTLP